MGVRRRLIAWVGAGLFRLARMRIAGMLIREVFAHMSFAIPVQRLRETPSLIAFFHPHPSYPVHILLVPKRTYQSIMDVLPEDCDFHRDLFATVQSLVHEFHLEEGGYRLITNGGAYQDIPILHFHLISNHE